MLKRSLSLVALFACLCGASIAQNITGTVVNKTTQKPAVGVDVALIDPTQSMAELTSAKTDSQGKFTLTSPSPAQGPRLVRTTKDGVNYFKFLPPGTTNVSAEIYDAAEKVDGITGTVNVMRVQADDKTLHVAQLFALTNSSNPPRTLQAERTFELSLPSGAQIEGASAQGPNGQPIQVSPTPTKNGMYAFSYALKPGETRFELAYHLPYNGQATLSPTLTRDFDHFVVVTPSSIKWQPKDASLFRPMQDQTGTNVQVLAKAKAGQDVSFTISGSGMIPEDNPQQAQGASGADDAMGGGRSGGPGGGLGAPIDAPDSLDKYRWPILGLLAILLTAGAFYTVNKTNLERATQPQVAVETKPQQTAPPVSAVATSQPASSGHMLLDAMKEELFQLEMERQSGQISDQEYAKAKAALDQTLARALSRGKRGQTA